MIGKGYDSIGTIITINSILSFGVTDNKKVFIVYDGKEYGKEYDSVQSQIDVNGKLVYLAKKDGKSFIVMEK